MFSSIEMPNKANLSTDKVITWQRMCPYGFFNVFYRSQCIGNFIYSRGHQRRIPCQRSHDQYTPADLQFSSSQTEVIKSSNACSLPSRTFSFARPSTPVENSVYNNLAARQVVDISFVF